MDLEFTFVSFTILKTVDLADLKGLLNFLSVGGESFADFAEILSFDCKKSRLSKIVKLTPLASAVLGIRICLNFSLLFLPSLLFLEFGRFWRINQIRALQNKFSALSIIAR